MLKKVATAPMAPVSAALDALVSIQRVALDGSEKLIDLQMRHLKNQVHESNQMLTELLNAPDPRACMTLAIEQARKGMSSQLAHGIALAGVTKDTQSSLSQVVDAALQRAGTE